MRLSRIDLREANDVQRRSPSAQAHKPARGIIQSVLPELESVKVETYGEPGTTTTAIRHPYMGVSSWIRAMPEPGTSVLTQQAREPAQLETWGYISHRLGGLLRKAREDNNYIYRELRPGEIELLSSGYAYQHLSEEGNVTLNGGIIEQTLSQTDLEASMRAPTHKRQLDQHGPTELAHEERFGLVKRPDQQKPNSLQVYMKDGSDFQYEYGRWLRDDAGKDIISLHEGHLYDVQRQQIKNGQTNRAVRLRRSITHRSSGVLTIDVDEELNILLSNSSQSKTTDLSFGAKNDVKVSSKKLDFNITKSSNQTFGTSLTMRAQKIQLNSSNVTFGPSASQSAVLGNILVSAILTPALSLIQSAFATVSADTALSSATRAALQTISTGGITAVQASLQQILSSDVKLTK